MLDKRYLRDHPDEARARLAQRGVAYLAPLERFLALDVERRSVQTELDTLKQERNNSSKEIGALIKAGKTEEAEERKVYVKTVNDEIAIGEARFTALDDEERELLLGLPNLTDPSVPEGPEDAAILLGESGTPREFDFEPLDHVELCRRLQLVNFEAGARVSGSGFPFLIGAGAQLQRALINFMLDFHIREHGYTEVRPPFLVRPEAPLGTGNLPKFGNQMYHVYVEDGSIAEAQVEDVKASYYLIPTAEVPVANFYREQILDQPGLPIRFCAYSPCFRVEAGSYGKDVRGLTRLHQFEKVELIRIADPASSFDDLEQMTLEAERILSTLGLMHRRKLLPTGDMAFGSAKTYDVEVYAPAAGQWLEVSSASNTTDFQARRMNLRIRREAGGKLEFPHILNTSGVALPRLMIAMLETYQQADGTVKLPQVLLPYFGGDGVIDAPVGGAPFV